MISKNYFNAWRTFRTGMARPSPMIKPKPWRADVPSAAGAVSQRMVIILALGILLAAGAYYALFLHNRDVRIINRHLNEIREQLTKKPNTGILLTAANARGITKHFTESVVIDAGNQIGSIQGHQALTTAIAQIHRFADELEVTIKDRRIEQLHDDYAQVYLMLEGSVLYQGDRSREVRVFMLSFVKQDGDWLIQRAERMETIKTPGG